MQDQFIVALLDGIEWLQESPSWPHDIIQSWLTESKSLTRRFERYCGKILVRRFREGFIPACIEATEAALLPDCGRFWLREVVLYGNDRPLLTARTLVPAVEKMETAQQVMNLGDRPLGQWLFRDHPPTRDVVKFGRAGILWARRTCFQLTNGEPLLLTEVFLPQCPLYVLGGNTSQH